MASTPRWHFIRAADYWPVDRRGVYKTRWGIFQKLSLELALQVEVRLVRNWSPEQIRDDLARSFPDPPEMHVSHETIYQTLFVQGRGHLRADLHKHLRTGGAIRRHRGEARRASWSKIRDMVLIRERPAEVEDRAVPGYWEADLIVGTNARSADAVQDAMNPTIKALPEHPRRSLTWDQGTELARHRDIALATDLAIDFCDKHKPWQRGSNENTNRLLRQYFPKSTDLTVHTPERLLDVATELRRQPPQNPRLPDSGRGIRGATLGPETTARRNDPPETAIG